MNHVSAFALCLSSFVAVAAIGCSGAPDPTPTSSSKKASTAGDSTKTPAGTKTPAANNSPAAPSTPAPSTPLSDTSACGKKADAKTCGDCCLAGTPTALDAADKVEGDCYCAAAACATQCAASVCATADNMNVPTADCNTCLTAHDMECGAKFDATCNADAACKAADACLTSQCDPLVPMTGGTSSGGAFQADAYQTHASSFTARAMARSADPQ